MKPLPREIVEESKTLFDDVRMADIDPDAHAAFVIARVLDRSTLRSVSALLRLYGREHVRAFFRAGGARQVTHRTTALWQRFLDIPEEWLVE